MKVMTYQLKQQTPMIHFQSGENGAALRASEVKPKLDSLIITQHERDRKPIPDIWYISREHPALNYKMRFEAKGNSQAVEIPYSIFYANMGSEQKLKMVIGDCIMTIVCFIPELAKVIQESLAGFFIANTFGFMQGKGFGGYLLGDGDMLPSQEQVKSALQQVWRCKKVYAITTKLPVVVVKRKSIIDGRTKETVPNNIFDHIIKPFHSMMKSGINNDRYERSYLFQYFHDNPNIKYGNDKAFVKSHGIAPVVYKQKTWRNGEETNRRTCYKYVRALLGITERVEYIHALDSNDKPMKDPKGKVMKDKIAIKGTNGIERFASPVRYRIIANTVYVFAVPIPDLLYGSNFTFSSGSMSGSISVPDKNEFDLEKFLDTFIKHVNTNTKARNVARFTNERFQEVK